MILMGFHGIPWVSGMLWARLRRCWSIRSNKLQQPFHGNGSSTNPADSWKSLDRFDRKPCLYSSLRKETRAETAYSLAISQSLRHICLSRIVEPVCGTILASCPIEQSCWVPFSWVFALWMHGCRAMAVMIAAISEELQEI